MWMMAADTWAAFKVYLTQSPPHNLSGRNSIACKLSQGFLCQETHSNISRIFALSFDASWNLFFLFRLTGFKPEEKMFANLSHAGF